jgi:C-terminal processing protease CtpA/Prc
MAGRGRRGPVTTCRAEPLALALWLSGCAATTAEPSLGSIGAIVALEDDGRLFVREVPSTDGLDDGLLPGDELVLIDGWSPLGRSKEELRSRLRGPIGTHVALTVVRGASVARLRIARTPLTTTPRAAEATSLAPTNTAGVTP